MTGTGEKGPTGPAGFTGARGITGATVPPVQYQYSVDPIGLTYDFQSVLTLPQVTINEGANVLLQGHIQVTFLPYLTAIRVPIVVNVLFNDLIIQSYSFYSIQQSSDSFPFGERASEDCPFSLTHYGAGGTGSYSLQVKLDQPVQDGLDLRVENSYLYAEQVEQEGAFAGVSIAYYLAAGGVQIFDAGMNSISTVSMYDNTVRPSNSIYAASVDGNYIYYAVSDMLYRFNIQEETVDRSITLENGMKASDLLLLPNQRYLFISDEASAKTLIYDINNENFYKTLNYQTNVLFSAASPDNKYVFFYIYSTPFSGNYTLPVYFYNIESDVYIGPLMQVPDPSSQNVSFSNPLGVTPDNEQVWLTANEPSYYYNYLELSNINFLGYGITGDSAQTSGLVHLKNGDSYVMGRGLSENNVTGITRFRKNTKLETYPGTDDQFAIVLSPDERWICIQGTQELVLFSTSEFTTRRIPLTDYTFQGGINFTRDSRYVVVIGTQKIYSIDVVYLYVQSVELSTDPSNQPLPYTLSSGVYKAQSK
ncbi:hypothetical protein [Paenibacillus sp. FSL H8-0048]|uniref:hypothetical protein n=1 Tax=Paenibacillus sp. FSL H8-0048 TaxID=2954508 RepID=UPI0040407B7B